MEKENKFINSTTIFAAISAYIYFVWFQFENGICTHYKIPNYLISPSISSLLICAATIISILIASLKSLGISTPLFKKLKNPNQEHMHPIYFINGFLLVVGILILFTFPFSWGLILCIIITSIIVNLVTWGIPYLFKIRQKRTFEEKIKESIEEAKNDQLDFLSLFNFSITKSQLIFVIVLICLPGITYLLGMGTAAGQNSYQVISNENNTAILKKYDDLIICRKFDLKTNYFSDTLIVIKLTDSKEYQLLEHKGIIKMKD